MILAIEAALAKARGLGHDPEIWVSGLNQYKCMRCGQIEFVGRCLLAYTDDETYALVSRQAGLTAMLECGRDVEIANEIDALNALLGEHEIDVDPDTARDAFLAAPGLGTATDYWTAASGLFADRELLNVERMVAPHLAPVLEEAVASHGDEIEVELDVADEIVTLTEDGWLVTVIDRVPVVGERGWCVPADLELDAALADIVRERGSAENEFGWSFAAEMTQPTEKGERIITVLVDRETASTDDTNDTGSHSLKELVRREVESLASVFEIAEGHDEHEDAADWLASGDSIDTLHHTDRLDTCGYTDAIESLGYLRGAADALDVTILELVEHCDQIPVLRAARTPKDAS